MTSTQIATYANEESLVIGASDLNLQVRLRRKIVPKFESDVGECAWRRKQTTITFAANDREEDLPSDFGKMLDGPMGIDSANNRTTLAYLGEDVLSIGLGNSSTEPGTPSGYWLVRDGGTPSLLKRMRLDRLPDTQIVYYYSYLARLQFSDDTTAYDFDNYIPREFQWALVEALKVEIFASRLSIDDPRIQAARAEYDRFVMDAQELREPGMRREIRRVKTGPL